MKLEKQVVSLKLAKQLKKLGVKQDSLFYWVQGLEISEFPNGDDYESNFYEKSSFELIDEKKGKHVKKILKDQDREERKMFLIYFYSAFTAAELGEMLQKAHCYSLKMDNLNKINVLKCLNIGGCDVETAGNTEADVRAKMFIHLIENKLLDPKESP